MNDQRRPMPSRIAMSTSSAEAMPSRTMRSAAPISAACMRLAMKPWTSRRMRIGAWPTARISACVRSTTAASVQGAGQISTSGVT